MSSESRDEVAQATASRAKCADSHNVHDATVFALLVGYTRNGPDAGKPNEREHQWLNRAARPRSSGVVHSLFVHRRLPNDNWKGSSMTDRFVDEIETGA